MGLFTFILIFEEFIDKSSVKFVLILLLMNLSCDSTVSYYKDLTSHNTILLHVLVTSANEITAVKKNLKASRRIKIK